MSGPAPKNRTTRQRRNKAATRATLPAETNPINNTPHLPDNPLGKWHKLSRRWWRDVWSSPMSAEYTRADLGALFRLVILIDKFWKTGDLKVASEVRLMEREFGLTPLSRRRLEWSIERSEQAKDRTDRERRRHARPVNGDDPRTVLK